MKRRELNDDAFFKLVGEIMLLADGLTCEQVQHVIGTVAKCAARCSRFDVNGEDFRQEIQRAAASAALNDTGTAH